MSDCESKDADFYRTVADSSQCWECLHGPADRIVYTSPSCRQITGYDPQQFYDDPELFFRIIHPDDLTRFRRHCTSDGAQPEQLQVRILHQSGRICWINHACTPMRDEEGRLLGRRSTNCDITAQVELQAELSKHAQFPQKNPDPVMQISADGVVLYMNPASVSVFESFALAPGRTAPEPFKTAAAKALNGGQRQETIRCDGKQYWLTFTAVENAVNVYGRDHTEQQKTHERFRLLSETAGQLLASDNPQAIVDKLCTAVMEHLECDCFFNYLADEVRGKLHLNACAGMPQETVASIEWLDYGVAVCGCVAKNGKRMIVEDVQHSPDERVRLIQSVGIRAYACHPMIGPGGKLVGTLAFATRAKDKFSKNDISLMKTIADLTATAMFRMQMEQELRESRQDLRRAQEVAQIGSWRLKIREDVLLWSDETYRIFGIPIGTPLTYERFLASVHPDDRQYVDDSWQAAMRGTPYDCEHRIVAEGYVKWVREKAHLEFDSSGSLVAGFGTVQDITHQKTEADHLRQVQRALHNGNQLLESVLDNTHVLVACMDKDFNFIRVNKAYARADDREVDFFPGKNHFDLYSNPQNEAIFRHVVETGEPYAVYARQFEYTANPERGPSWWDWSLVPIRDECGQVVRLVLTLADVTEQKKSQDLHERIARRQAALLSASEEILEAGSIEALLDTVSRTARVITQAHMVLAESVYEKRVYSSMTPCPAEHPAGGKLAGFKECLYHLLSEPGQSLCLAKEQLRSHPLGAHLSAEHVGINGLMAAPMINRAGQVNGLILLAEKEAGAFTEDDEAELRQLAAISSLALQHLEARDQLKHERDQLEERVRTRTEDLERTVITLGEEVLQRVKAENDLHATNIELQRRAERLSKMASELTVAEHRERFRLAQVLHDHLQQLLVAANIELSTAVRKITHHEPRKILENVKNIVKQSIDASRTLTVELYPPILHEAGLIGGLEWLVRWMQEKHGLTVELDKGDVNIKREDVCILLFQSIRELLFNTVKHSGVRDARVEVRRKGDFVEVRIADQGKGFDASKIFERAANESARFGLFSIRERLTSMGGKLEIVSAPGAGCTFILTAPADITIKPEELIASRRKIEDIKANTHAVGTPKADKIRILLVDDHMIMRRGLATLLRQEPDMQVIAEAVDGPEAIELALQLKPDVVLMDFSLPGMSGAEATRAICSQLPHVRVIGLSMFDEQDRAAAMLEAGASAYASKSESPVILLTAIRAVTTSLKDVKTASQKRNEHRDLDPGGKPA